MLSFSLCVHFPVAVEQPLCPIFPGIVVTPLSWKVSCFASPAFPIPLCGSRHWVSSFEYSLWCRINCCFSSNHAPPLLTVQFLPLFSCPWVPNCFSPLCPSSALTSARPAPLPKGKSRLSSSYVPRSNPRAYFLLLTAAGEISLLSWGLLVILST